MDIEKPITLDLLDTGHAPALSSTSDMPIVETKPDATPAPAEAKEEVPAATSEEVTTDSESATEPEIEPSANDEPKKAKGVQKRLDELTRQREEAQRRAEAAEAERARLLDLLERQMGIPPEATPQEQEVNPEPVRPSKADYVDPDAYEQALETYYEQKAIHTARQEIAAAQREAEAQAQANAVEQAKRAAQEAYTKRLNDAKAKYADFTQVAETPDVQVSMAIATAILHSESGPELQYYLGKHPEEAQRLNALPPPLQLTELGKIEAKLTVAPSAPAPAPKPAPVVSKAPAPIKPISQAAPSGVSQDPNEMTSEQYRAWRQSQQQSNRVRH